MAGGGLTLPLDLSLSLLLAPFCLTKSSIVSFPNPRLSSPKTCPHSLHALSLPSNSTIFSPFSKFSPIPKLYLSSPPTLCLFLRDEERLLLQPLLLLHIPIKPFHKAGSQARRIWTVCKWYLELPACWGLEAQEKGKCCSPYPGCGPKEGSLYIFSPYLHSCWEWGCCQVDPY